MDTSTGAHHGSGEMGSRVRSQPRSSGALIRVRRNDHGIVLAQRPLHFGVTDHVGAAPGARQAAETSATRTASAPPLRQVRPGKKRFTETISLRKSRDA